MQLPGGISIPAGDPSANINPYQADWDEEYDESARTTDIYRQGKRIVREADDSYHNPNRVDWREFVAHRLLPEDLPSDEETEEPEGWETPNVNRRNKQINDTYRRAKGEPTPMRSFIPHDLAHILSPSDPEYGEQFVEQINRQYPRANISEDLPRGDELDDQDKRWIRNFAKTRQRSLDRQDGYGAARTDSRVKRIAAQQQRYLKRPGEPRRLLNK